MDIFEFAMQMERDGAKLYRDLAEKSRDAGVKHILTQMAEDEDKHLAVLQAMSESRAGEMSESSVLTDAINIFAGITVDDLDLSAEQVDIYRRAVEIEKKSEDFYLEKAEEAEEESHRELFRRLAGEEARHRRLLEGMVDFLEEPRSWLENAEFTNLVDH